jgi:hypothetical protein
MRYLEFKVVEAQAEDTIKELEKMGFTDVARINGKTIHVYVPNKQRPATMSKLLGQIQGSRKESTSGSSLGLIVHPNGTKIMVKPAGKQGVESAGLKNEQHLIQKINQFIGEVGPLDITFVGDNGKNIIAKGVTEAQGAGTDTKGRKKSDVNLISSGKSLPISIKARTADYWESADTLFGEKADQIITKLLKKKLVTLTPREGMARKSDGKQKVKISPEIAMKLSKEQVLDVVFGSDILAQGGGIVKESFEDEHYVLKANNLTVTADVIIKQIEDIPDYMQPYLHIRNAHDRNRGLYPGTKVQASYQRRAKNAITVDEKGEVIQLSKKQRQAKDAQDAEQK